MFDQWDSFYVMIGSASAALIGLMFVVATLTNTQNGTPEGAAVFITPVVFHYAVVLVVSAMALTPHVSAPADGVLVGGVALVGLANSGLVVWRLSSGKMSAPHWSDVWCYGVVPTVIYVGLLACAVAVGAASRWAADALGAALMALLLISIRNAWDLVTWLAPRKNVDLSGGSN
jgi:hypothetical protein